MRLDLKIQDKSNEARFFISKPVSFMLLKTDFFTIFVGKLLIFLRVMLNFIVPTEGNLQITYSNLRC